MTIRILIAIAVALALATLVIGLFPGTDVLVAERDCPMVLLPSHGHVTQCDPGWHPIGETTPAADPFGLAILFVGTLLPAVWVWRFPMPVRAIGWSVIVWAELLLLRVPIDFDLRLGPGDRWPVAAVGVLEHAMFAIILAAVPLAALVAIARPRAT